MPRLLSEYSADAGFSGNVVFPADRIAVKRQISSKLYRLKKTLIHTAAAAIRSVVSFIAGVFSLSGQKTKTDQKKKAFSLVSSFSGALSVGLTLFTVLAFFAAEERGYMGAVGGEVFAVIAVVYIVQRLISYLCR